MIRVAVIGAGGMGACHARNIMESAGADVAWVADPATEVARVLAGEVGASWTADGHQALADCDAAVIACPDRFHGEFVIDAIERGLPILCEKPLTVDLDEARRIVDAESAGDRRLVQLGFMRVYDERHEQVRDALAPLGAVHHLRCVHRNTAVEPRSVSRLLVESVIHDIHTVRWLAGDEIVDVFTSVVRGPRDSARFLLLTCRLAGGGVATIEFDDRAAGYEVSVEVSAERGNVVSSDPSRAVVRADGKISSSIGDDWFAPFLSTYRREMRVWLDSVASGTATGPTAWDGFAAQAVVDAAVASHHSGGAETVVLPSRPDLHRIENS
jgi:myo-inositol 2-dehydrogenase / D-chiro-inositol 1-dehydrogenase